VSRQCAARESGSCSVCLRPIADIRYRRDAARMRRHVPWLSAITVALGLTTEAPAQPPASPEAMRELRGIVHELAFAPSKFFIWEDGEDASDVKISYTGDDYGWPVFSIAILIGCVPDEPRLPNCGSRLTARLVRAPAPAGLTRPRQRGTHLLRGLIERRATTAEAVRRQLTGLGVEWRQADLATCRGARAVYARAGRLTWVPQELIRPRSSEPDIVVHLHADRVSVEFETLGQSSRYRGAREKGTPAEWAVELAEALEPCWRPAPSAAPWVR
jgi:hypothetical protein